MCQRWALKVCGLVSAVFESGAVDWAGRLIFAIGWQVIVLSAMAYSIFYWLLRRDQAIRVTSLFYLMPPTAAVMGNFLFDDVFGPAGLAGLVVAMIGFWLVFFFRKDVAANN